MAFRDEPRAQVIPAYRPEGISSETYPRWATDTQSPVIAGRLHLSRIPLDVGDYATLSFLISTATTTATNAHLALYDLESLELLASADITAGLNALPANNVGSFAMPISILIAKDYALGILVGGGGLPALQRTQLSNAGANGLLTLDPQVTFSHNVGGLVAPPNPLVLEVPNAQDRWYWFRYV